MRTAISPRLATSTFFSCVVCMAKSLLPAAHRARTYFTLYYTRRWGRAPDGKCAKSRGFLSVEFRRSAESTDKSGPAVHRRRAGRFSPASSAPASTPKYLNINVVQQQVYMRTQPPCQPAASPSGAKTAGAQSMRPCGGFMVRDRAMPYHRSSASSSTSCSVFSQPMQGSVMDRPYTPPSGFWQPSSR